MQTDVSAARVRGQSSRILLDIPHQVLPAQVSGPLVGGGCRDKSPQVTWPPPSWGFPTSRLLVAHFLWVESIWDTKAGNAGCHSHTRPSRIKTPALQAPATSEVWGCALGIVLWCECACVIFLWINASLENSQAGLSRDRVTSVPGTATRGLGAEDTESMWISGALTFWNNDPGKQSSPGFPFPFQDAESPAETLPGSGCSLAGLCQGHAWSGPAAGRGDRDKDGTPQGTAFPETPHSRAILAGMGQ